MAEALLCRVFSGRPSAAKSLSKDFKFTGVRFIGGCPRGERHSKVSEKVYSED